VRADGAVEPGSYSLRVAFRGAPASTMQNYKITVYADDAAMREASTSYLRRITGYNPFVLAAGCGGLALLVGVMVYRLGCRYIRQLTSLGCGEISARAAREDQYPAGPARPYLVPALWAARPSGWRTVRGVRRPGGAPWACPRGGGQQGHA